MMKNNSKRFKKFIPIFVVSLLSLFLLGAIISSINGFQLRDVVFVEGILILMIGIFSSISGSTQNLSLQEFGQINPQYFANIILDSSSIKKEKSLVASNIQINIDLVNTSIIVGAIIALIISFLL